MARPLPTWITTWIFLTTIIVIWDALWVLFARYHIDSPSSPYHTLAKAVWQPYELYISVDRRYADKGDGFVVAQSWVNLAELLLAMYAAFLNHRRCQEAKLWAFLSSFATFLKTFIYFGCEIWSTVSPSDGPAHAFHYTWHNDEFSFWILFVLPSSFWLVIPALISVVLGSHIAEALHGDSPRCSAADSCGSLSISDDQPSSLQGGHRKPSNAEVVDRLLQRRKNVDRIVKQGLQEIGHPQ